MTEHRVTTTMRPDDVVVVNDQELLDLTRMGLIAAQAPFTLDEVPAPISLPIPKEEPDGEEEDHS